MIGRGSGLERITIGPSGEIVVEKPSFPPMFKRVDLDPDYCPEPKTQESIQEETPES